MTEIQRAPRPRKHQRTVAVPHRVDTAAASSGRVAIPAHTAFRNAID